jgi:two-component system LytT family response regulator
VIRVVIVDDEPPARQNLRVLLGRLPDVEIVAEAGSGTRAIQAIEEHDPDLVFLDVQMPEMDGFDVIDAIGPERMPITVFVTAYDRYALRAFEVRALDYLLKPYDDKRFAATMERVRERIRTRAEGDFGRRMLELMEERRAGVVAAPPTGALRHLTVRGADSVRLLKVDDVVRFEAAGDYVRAWVAGGSHLIDDAMKELEERLDPSRFVRIHRSHIVRVGAIRELQPFLHGDWIVVLEDGTKLRLSRTRRPALERALGRDL